MGSAKIGDKNRSSPLGGAEAACLVSRLAKHDLDTSKCQPFLSREQLGCMPRCVDRTTIAIGQSSVGLVLCLLCHPVGRRIRPPSSNRPLMPTLNRNQTDYPR